MRPWMSNNAKCTAVHSVQLCSIFAETSPYWMNSLSPPLLPSTFLPLEVPGASGGTLAADASLHGEVHLCLRLPPPTAAGGGAHRGAANIVVCTSAPSRHYSTALLV